MRDSGLMEKLNSDFIFNFTIISFMREIVDAHLNEIGYFDGILQILKKNILANNPINFR